MIIHRWLQGLLARRLARLIGAVLGVATTITLLSSLGIFLSTSSQTMTARAVSTVPIDWQVQLARGADEGVVMEALSRTSSFELMERVGYAKVAGFRSCHRRHSADNRALVCVGNQSALSQFLPAGNSPTDRVEQMASW